MKPNLALPALDSVLALRVLHQIEIASEFCFTFAVVCDAAVDCLLVEMFWQTLGVKGG